MKLKEGLEQAAGAATGTAGKKTPAKGKKAAAGAAAKENGSTPSKVRRVCIFSTCLC